MPDILTPWESVTIYLGAAYRTKQDDKLPPYIIALTKGTTGYEKAIQKSWLEFKRNPTEANAKKFADFLKTYSSKHWPEVVKSVLNVSELAPKQRKMLEDALEEHHDYVLTSLLPDVIKGIGDNSLDSLDHRATFLYAGALWAFGMLATVMFDGLEIRDLADLFLFAGPNDTATCTGDRGCQQYAGKVFTVAQILADQIIPGRLRCITNCRHMLLPVASPLNKKKAPKVPESGFWQEELKHLPGKHDQSTHGRGRGKVAGISPRDVPNSDAPKSVNVIKSRELAAQVDAQKKDCYRNSVLAMQLVEGSMYVEGYVILTDLVPIPIEHGWLESGGEVIDPTLALFDNDFSQYTYIPGKYYTQDMVENEVGRSGGAILPLTDFDMDRDIGEAQAAAWRALGVDIGGPTLKHLPRSSQPTYPRSSSKVRWRTNGQRANQPPIRSRLARKH